MKISEVRDMSVTDLNKKLAELKDELFNLRFQHAVNQLEDPMRLKVVKKDIARIKTVLREIELSGENALRKGGNDCEREKS